MFIGFHKKRIETNSHILRNARHNFSNELAKNEIYSHKSDEFKNFYLDYVNKIT